MNAAGTDQAHQMQSRMVSLNMLDCFKEIGIEKEGAVGNSGINPGQVLEDNLAGADVNMADFGVAVFSGGETDRLTGSN